MFGNDLSLKKYCFPRESFIGGWYIPEHICDGLIQYFYDQKKFVSKGTIGDYRVKSKNTVNLDYKDSFDLNVLPYEKNEYLKAYSVYLNSCLSNYIKEYEFVNQNYFFSLSSYNIQYYPVGGGFKKWHFERTTPGSNVCKRVLVFMTYLNNVDDGGTEFYYQNIKTKAEKGLTLIWPTDFTHTHKGIISNTKEKYIATGWFNYNSDE
jgi:hypothetical protein